MESQQPTEITVTDPTPVAAAGGPGQTASTPPPEPSGRRWRRRWHFDPVTDTVLASMSLGISFGIAAAFVLSLPPGAAVLAALGFWFPHLILAWQTSVIISFGISMILLLLLWIFNGFDGRRSVAAFAFLWVCALVAFGVFYDRNPELFVALAGHLTR